MKNSKIQSLVFLIIIFVVPWIWSSTKGDIKLEFYYQLLYLVSALLLNVIFIGKLNFIFWKLVIISIILIPFSMELMHFVSFKIHWANNDVHYIDPSSGAVEMYQDYNSFFDFSYVDGNWSYRLLLAFYNVLTWCAAFGFFFLIKIYKEKDKKEKRSEVLDSEI